MKNACACDMFAHALCNEHSRRRLAVAAALRRPTKDASLYEACLDGVAEIVQLIRRVTDIMVEAIKQSKNAMHISPQSADTPDPIKNVGGGVKK